VLGQETPVKRQEMGDIEFDIAHDRKAGSTFAGFREYTSFSRSVIAFPC
jgi:hypothetical protein